MESIEDSNHFSKINEEKMKEQFKDKNKSDLNIDPIQKTNSILEESDDSKIIDEFFKKQKYFEENKEQWKSFIKMIASKFGNSKDELESISKLKTYVGDLIEFLPKFQISLANYESSLLLNEKHEVYQKLFNQIISIKTAIDIDDFELDLKKIFIDSVNKFYVEIEEYEKLSAFKFEVRNFDNKFKETIELIDQIITKMKKEKEGEEFKRSDNLNIRREWNQIIQKPLKVIKMVEIDEIGGRNQWLEMDTHEGLGYTSKSFFSKKNGKTNFYIHLLENKTGETIQEIMIKEFVNGSFPRCKWNKTKDIGKLKLAVFTCYQPFGFILELDENSKKLKENYQKFEIGNGNNYQMIYSEKHAIINHASSNGITVFDSITHQKIENVKESNWVYVGGFYDKDNYIYPDIDNRIFNYNLKTKKQKIVNGNHSKNNLIYWMKISKKSNTMILGDKSGNIYIYKLNLANQQFASFQNSISTGDSNTIYRMQFISIDKLIIANRQKNLKIVYLKSGKIEEKEIIKGNQLGIYDFKFDGKNGVIVVLACDFSGSNKSQIHFLSE